ncbi:hypothetical protein, partial [Zavarzinella formosa]|uniref:hypothetical protein n=1 Tax=Zavarzinella formosa TaxID=360055 RepID=UPI00187DACA7
MRKREWIRCSDPERMIDDLWKVGSLQRLDEHRSRTDKIISDRSFILFVLMAGKRLWTDAGFDILRPAVGLAWRRAEHGASNEEVARQLEELRRIYYEEAIPTGNWQLARLVKVLTLLFKEPGSAARTLVFPHPFGDPPGDQPVRLLSQAELTDSCRLIREIFGDPSSHLVILEPAWLTFDVRMIAAGAYEDQAFNRLPILADALQDAGCDNEDILSHLRAEGPHVRGCWALDLILGKS